MNFLHDLTWVLPLRSPALTQLAFGLSWLGYTTFIMFFMALGYWTWSKAIFYRLLILVALNALINAYAKDLFQDPRPPLEIRLDDLVGASYGLPSGHAQLAVVMWMWLAWEIRKTWAWITGATIAVGVMASRMYLGVHDLEDVLVGALLGGASLLCFEAARRKVTPDSLPLQLTIILGVPALALLSWPGTAPEYIPLLAGWMAAATWGLRVEKQTIGMTAPNTWAKRVGVVLLGTAAFMAEQKLLKVVGIAFPINATLWALIKGVTSGLFISLLMPWLLCKVRLTNEKKLS